MRAKYYKLALQIARDEIASHCAEIRPQFAAYSAVEHAGKNPRDEMPEVWSHLQACEECRFEYSLLAAKGEQGQVSLDAETLNSLEDLRAPRQAMEKT